MKGKLANGVGSQYSHATSERSISSITQADAHTSAASSRLKLTPPTYLNGLVRFGERRDLVSARVPSRSARAIPLLACVTARKSAVLIYFATEPLSVTKVFVLAIFLNPSCVQSEAVRLTLRQ